MTKITTTQAEPFLLGLVVCLPLAHPPRPFRFWMYKNVDAGEERQAKPLLLLGLEDRDSESHVPKLIVSSD